MVFSNEVDTFDVFLCGGAGEGFTFFYRLIDLILEN